MAVVIAVLYLLVALGYSAGAYNRDVDSRVFRAWVQGALWLVSVIICAGVYLNDWCETER